MSKVAKPYTNPKTGETSTLYYNDEGKPYLVERVTADGEDAVHTGIWTEGSYLADYDGVNCLHEDTAKVLRLNGIRVPKDEFETVGKA